MSHSAHMKAALLYVLPVLALLGMWYLLLFTGTTSASSPGSTLLFLLTEGPKPNWFRWLLLLPLLCAVLAAAHVSRLTRTRSGSVLLLVIGSGLAAAAWLTVAREIALFVSLPLVYGFLGAKSMWRPIENGV